MLGYVLTAPLGEACRDTRRWYTTWCAWVCSFSRAPIFAGGSPLHSPPFFFSSRRRHTRLQGDWSSDVCSSDLRIRMTARPCLESTEHRFSRPIRGARMILCHRHDLRDGLRTLRRQPAFTLAAVRSEERRVGKGCRSRMSAWGCEGG